MLYLHRLYNQDDYYKCRHAADGDVNVEVICVTTSHLSSRGRNPSSGALLQVSSFSLKGVLQFFLTRFEGLRPEFDTSVHIVLLLT